MKDKKKCSIIIRSFDDNPKRCVDFFLCIVQCGNEKDKLRMHDGIESPEGTRHEIHTR
jgi:hypothetical protein